MTADKPQPATTDITRLRPIHRTTARRFVVTNKRKHKSTKCMIAPTARSQSMPSAKHDTVAKFPSLGSRCSDLLRGRLSEDRNPMWARFSSLVQTYPGVNPTSYTVGIWFFPGLKRPRPGVDHANCLATRSKKV